MHTGGEHSVALRLIRRCLFEGEGKKGSKINLVFDLGGRTSDVSILEVSVAALSPSPGPLGLKCKIHRQKLCLKYVLMIMHHPLPCRWETVCLTSDNTYLWGG